MKTYNKKNNRILNNQNQFNNIQIKNKVVKMNFLLIYFKIHMILRIITLIIRFLNKMKIR